MWCQRRSPISFPLRRRQLQKDCGAWRDECQLNINGLAGAYRASVDPCDEAAQLVGSPTLAAWLRAPARHREHLVPLFEQQVRALDDRPRVPDPEMQLVEQALPRVKAVLPTGGRHRVLKERS